MMEAVVVMSDFQAAMQKNDRNSSHQSLINGDNPAIKLTPLDIIILPPVLDASSPVSIVLYSIPRQLGIFTPSADGGLSVQIVIPNDVPTGYHTLVLSGKTYSGEDIDLWQIIEVQGADPSDRDEDGIPDASDQCRYIVVSDQDDDGDGIDDACDPFIGDAKADDERAIATLASVKQKFASIHGQPLAGNSSYGTTEANSDVLSGRSMNISKQHTALNRSDDPRHSLIFYIVGSLVALGLIAYTIVYKIRLER